MLSLLTSAQTRNADAYTIANKPIASIDLMEAAARAFVHRFLQHFPDNSTSVSVYCGTGNNGGDGLAIARMLMAKGYNVSVRIAFFSSKSSPDFEVNLQQLADAGITYTKIDIGNLDEDPADVLIDALLGSGLNKPLQGDWAILANHINGFNKVVVAVDMPTGMPSEGEILPGQFGIKASLAITFQRPKINFFFPESSNFLERFETADIGLDEKFIQSLSSNFELIEEADIKKLLRPRKPFSHKGTYGHALIVAGTKETMGAALLCAEASLYTGSGLTTACIPPEGLTALNTRMPEVMALLRSEGFRLPQTAKYTAIAIGPGLGKGPAEKELLQSVFALPVPLVLDADALNILAENPELISTLPAGTVVTPHMKEFDRLFGNQPNWWQRVETAREQAQKLNIVLILKNRYTFIALPNGKVLINTTGGSNMAIGGMGDVLTGMIVSFLAQGYAADEAAMLAVYLHGLCGEKHGGYVCLASELVKEMPHEMGKMALGK